MPAQVLLFYAIHDEVSRLVPALRPISLRRLALLVPGIVAAKQCTLAHDCHRAPGARAHARLLCRAHRTSAAPSPERSGSHRRLLPRPSPHASDWTALRRQTGHILLILDETTKRDVLHLVRISLAHRGSVIRLAWAVWEQNITLPEGAYWKHLEDVLLAAASLLPPDARVVLVADRVYDTPPFLDWVTAPGWHWIIRCKAKAATRLHQKHSLCLANARHHNHQAGPTQAGTAGSLCSASSCT